MKLLYKPFGIIIGIAAGMLAREVFNEIWGHIDDKEPPEATTLDASWPQVLGAAAVQGATFAVTRAAVNRGGAKGYQWLTGVWPGETRPDPVE